MQTSRQLTVVGSHGSDGRMVALVFALPRFSNSFRQNLNQTCTEINTIEYIIGRRIFIRFE